ncbi:MAG: EscU/YscU/HrcU family type III secretion system export apparatus switch protein [Pseudomonadota bacterium]
MSGGEEESAEKSLEPTDRKLEEARGQGDIPRSADAQAAAAYLGLALALALSSRDTAAGLGVVLRRLTERPDHFSREALLRAEPFAEILSTEVARAMAPILLLPGLGVLVFLLASRGVVLAPSKLVPKLSRISPIENAKQRFGPTGLVEFAKACVKLSLLSVVLVFVLWSMVGDIAASVHIPARALTRALEMPLYPIVTGTVLVSLMVGLADFVWQRHSHRARHRMTREAMKKEMRESEGDPQTNARRQERAKEIATGRMLEAVPEASVVITNPTHYAVALAWNRAADAAPRCVAKGVDDVAEAIRTRAEAAGVPIRPDPPTARALHATTRVGQEIAPEHYRAVAAAILFAEEMRDRQRAASAGND